MTIAGSLTCEANMSMKKKYKLVMKVPKTPKSAYDHGRFISSLIEHQLKHFNEVEKSLLKAGQKLTDISKIKTELQASKYLKKMTALLHPQGAEKRGKAAGTRKTKKAAKRKSIAKRKQGKRKSR
jgi:hypothetical protein